MAATDDRRTYWEGRLTRDFNLVHDVFVLDLGTNRYVMTRTGDLAPLLDLPPARLAVSRDGDRLELRHVDGPAAIGVIVEDARPDEADGWLDTPGQISDK